MRMRRHVRRRAYEYVRPAMIQISLRIREVWSESSLGAFWMAKNGKFLSADDENWSAQADLSLRWAHTQEGTFFYVAYSTCMWKYFVPIQGFSTLQNRQSEEYVAIKFIQESYGMQTEENTKLDYITKTCLYSFDPLKPHFYIVKPGFTGVYIISFISAQNIDCGYSLEPPRRGGCNEYP